jgi:general secretion pathway protein C
LQLSWQPKQLRVLIVLVTLGFCAYFLARGTTNLVALKVLPYHVSVSAPTGGVASELKGERPPDAHAILHRNFFDSSTGPLWPLKEEPTDPAATDPTQEHNDQSLAAGQMPPPCEGSVRLVASMYDPRDDAWSFASVSLGSGSPLLYRLGNPIENRKVEAIYPEAVFLKGSNGALCSLTMFKSANAPPPKPNAPPPPAVAEAASSGDAELDQGIKQVTETKYSVRRTLVDKLLQNQSELIKQARVVPHEENGRVVGVKLYGIRKSSLFGKLGLQNGDMLRTINGFDMSSPDSALEAYTKLRSASNLSLAIVRRGNAVTMDYNIGN